MSQKPNNIISILIIGLIFSFGVLSAIGVMLVRNVSSVMSQAAELQRDMAQEIALTKECLDKVRIRPDEELIRRVINTSNHPMMGVQNDGKIVAWSNGAEKVLEYEKLEAIGRPVHMLIPDVLKDDHIKKFDQKMKSRDPQIFERYLTCRAVAKSGKEVLVHVTVIGTTDGISVGTIEVRK